MSENGDTAVRIGVLSLRIPGADARLGHRVASQIGEHLARGLRANGGTRMGALDLRVRLPTGVTSTDAICAAVTNAIAGVLDRGNSVSRGKR